MPKKCTPVHPKTNERIMRRKRREFRALVRSGSEREWAAKRAGVTLKRDRRRAAARASERLERKKKRFRRLKRKSGDRQWAAERAGITLPSRTRRSKLVCAKETKR